MLLDSYWTLDCGIPPVSTRYLFSSYLLQLFVVFVYSVLTPAPAGISSGGTWL